MTIYTLFSILEQLGYEELGQGDGSRKFKKENFVFDILWDSDQLPARVRDVVLLADDSKISAVKAYKDLNLKITDAEASEAIRQYVEEAQIPEVEGRTAREIEVAEMKRQCNF